MNFEKSTPESLAIFASLAPTGPLIEQKKVFGYPACFVNGNMFTALHGNTMIIRLDLTKRQQFIDQTGGQIFEPMPGRAMKEYVAVPAELFNQQSQLDRWLAYSLEYASSLPPKVKKGK